MEAVFKSELNSSEIENIRKFCNSAEYCSLEQSIGFTDILFQTKITYFYLIDDKVIKSFSQINETFKSAHIWFGPVCCDKDLMITSINEIIKFYKKRQFCYLGVQMYYKSGYETDYIEYALNKLHNIKYIFNNENTKSSLEINLEESIEEISGKMRKGHRSDIKKAVKSELTVKAITDTSELTFFADVYSKMCKARNYSGHSLKEINGIYDYLNKYRKGQVLVVKDSSNKILGGIFLAYQGISVRYLLGASDPGRRDLPVLHLVIYEAIIRAKADNFKYFDFWGYNHFADEDGQVYNLNHFKKGFGGYYTFFAKKMNIELVPNGYNFYRYFSKVRKLIKRFH